MSEKDDNLIQIDGENLVDQEQFGCEGNSGSSFVKTQTAGEISENLKEDLEKEIFERLYRLSPNLDSLDSNNIRVVLEGKITDLGLGELKIIRYRLDKYQDKYFKSSIFGFFEVFCDIIIDIESKYFDETFEYFYSLPQKTGKELSFITRYYKHYENYGIDGLKNIIDKFYDKEKGKIVSLSLIDNLFMNFYRDENFIRYSSDIINYLDGLNVGKYESLEILFNYYSYYGDFGIDGLKSIMGFFYDFSGKKFYLQDFNIIKTRFENMYFSKEVINNWFAVKKLCDNGKICLKEDALHNLNDYFFIFVENLHKIETGFLNLLFDNGFTITAKNKFDLRKFSDIVNLGSDLEKYNTKNDKNILLKEIFNNCIGIFQKIADSKKHPAGKKTIIDMYDLGDYGLIDFINIILSENIALRELNLIDSLTSEKIFNLESVDNLEFIIKILRRLPKETKYDILGLIKIRNSILENGDLKDYGLFDLSKNQLDLIDNNIYSYLEILKEEFKKIDRNQLTDVEKQFICEKLNKVDIKLGIIEKDLRKLEDKLDLYASLYFDLFNGKEGLKIATLSRIHFIKENGLINKFANFLVENDIDFEFELDGNFVRWMMFIETFNKYEEFFKLLNGYGFDIKIESSLFYKYDFEQIQFDEFINLKHHKGIVVDKLKKVYDYFGVSEFGLLDTSMDRNNSDNPFIEGGFMDFFSGFSTYGDNQISENLIDCLCSIIDYNNVNIGKNRRKLFDFKNITANHLKTLSEKLKNNYRYKNFYELVRFIINIDGFFEENDSSFTTIQKQSIVDSLIDFVNNKYLSEGSDLGFYDTYISNELIGNEDIYKNLFISFDILRVTNHLEAVDKGYLSNVLELVTELDVDKVKKYWFTNEILKAYSQSSIKQFSKGYLSSWFQDYGNLNIGNKYWTDKKEYDKLFLVFDITDYEKTYKEWMYQFSGVKERVKSKFMHLNTMYGNHSCDIMNIELNQSNWKLFLMNLCYVNNYDGDDEMMIFGDGDEVINLDYNEFAEFFRINSNQIYDYVFEFAKQKIVGFMSGEFLSDEDQNFLKTINDYGIGNMSYIQNILDFVWKFDMNFRLFGYKKREKRKERKNNSVNDANYKNNGDIVLKCLENYENMGKEETNELILILGNLVRQTPAIAKELVVLISKLSRKNLKELNKGFLNDLYIDYSIINKDWEEIKLDDNDKQLVERYIEIMFEKAYGKEAIDDYFNLEEYALNFKKLNSENYKELRKKHKYIRSLIEYRKIIKELSYGIDSGENFKNLLQTKSKQVKERVLEKFKTGLGIIKIPDNLTKEHLEIIKSFLIYYANIEGGARDDRAMISLYLALYLDGKWEDFRMGKDIDYSEYVSDDILENIYGCLDDLKKFNSETFLKLEDIGERDFELFQKEEVNTFIGDIETIDIRLGSINQNIVQGLNDEDLFGGDECQLNIFLWLKEHDYDISIIKTWGGILAKKFQKLNKKDIKFKDEEIELMQKDKDSSGNYIEGTFGKLMQDWTNGFDNPIVLKTVQDNLKIVGIVVKLWNETKNLEIDDKLSEFEELLIPDDNLIKLFEKVGEQLTTRSGIIPITTDINYLLKIVENNKDNLVQKEYDLLVEYLGEVKHKINGLYDIKTKIDKLFDDSHKLLGKTNNFDGALRQKIESLREIIFKKTSNNEVEIYSKISGSIVNVIDHIRECLSCQVKQCNNDTNLSFGDFNRFFITSHTPNSTKSFSDQLVTLYDSDQGPVMVIDILYGKRSFDIFNSNLRLVIKKLTSLQTRGIKILVTSKVLNGHNIDPRKMFEKICKDEGYDGDLKGKTSIELDSMSVGIDVNVSVDIHKHVSGDSFNEFHGYIARSSGKQECNGLLIELK